MIEKAEIHYNPDGSLSALIGPDAIELMRVQSIIQGIKLHIKSGGRMMITRGMGITKLLALATTYTGKKYKRTEGEQAMQDLNVWFQTMKSSIPTITK